MQNLTLTAFMVFKKIATLKSFCATPASWTAEHWSLYKTLIFHLIQKCYKPMVLVIQADGFLQKIQFLDVLGAALFVVLLTRGLACLILVELQLVTHSKVISWTFLHAMKEALKVSAISLSTLCQRNKKIFHHSRHLSIHNRGQH